MVGVMKEFYTWQDIWLVMYRLECNHQDLRVRQAWINVLQRVQACVFQCVLIVIGSDLVFVAVKKKFRLVKCENKGCERTSSRCFLNGSTSSTSSCS